MTALALLLVLLVAGCGDSPTEPQGTSLDGRQFYLISERTVRVDSRPVQMTVLIWWRFDGESLEHADGSYSLYNELLTTTDAAVIPPDGEHLYHSWGQYIFSESTLKLLRQGGRVFSGESMQDLDRIIPSGLDVVDFGDFVSIDGAVYEQTDERGLNAVRTAMKSGSGSRSPLVLWPN